ncbi:PIN-like domain-containing protein [Catalinimonas niigatensis]|uniref:PIN-like domain-containing protein n=1 Tax=Catalinimonas niigatensis TaxID=1397264 RepID=UPI002665AC9D|nr:PIN-like domain-containing protein [Catalinimonas niigatensis]WPP49654.1 PIN-like domain-containing protein [Catalinimonas niigatensis]
MENTFKEYYRLSQNELKNLWETGIIVLDTNILLNFYRYSDSTISEFLNVLEKLRERLWLPYQIGREFHEERLDVIQQQIKVYSDSISKIDDIKKDFSNKNRNPFLSDELYAQFSNVLNKVNAELILKKEKYESRLSNDDVLVQISTIFNDRNGQEYIESKIKEIYSTGEKRYKDKIPPGYKDNNKPQNKKFGDLIIWFQLIDKVEEIKKPILYVTDDSKEDWWLIKSGKKLGPRPELRKEFFQKTNQLFYIYQPFKFLEFAKEKLSINIKETTIDEVKELKPINNDRLYQIDNELLISITLEKNSDKHNLDGFINLLESFGYDTHIEKLNELNCKIFILAPNIPDITRRIRTKFVSQIESYGLKLIDFKPEIKGSIN